MRTIKVNKLSNHNIFASEFENLQENNIISFSSQGIAVVYGPNGTGKTTLSKTLGGDEGTDFIIEYNNQIFTTENSNNLFYVIKDQNNRHIISGETKEFLLGDNIRYRFELRSKIDNNFKYFCSSCADILKNKYFITTKTSKLFNFLTNSILKNSLKNLANKSSRGKDIKISELITLVNTLSSTPTSLSEIQETKLDFFLQEYKNKKSVIDLIMELTPTVITPNSKVGEIEENNEAIKILNKFPTMHQCVVCDNEDICVETLLDSKTQNKEIIINSLSDEIKDIMELVPSVENDPFNIKNTMISFLETGDISFFTNLQSEFENIKTLFISCLEYDIYKLLETSNLYTDWNEYEEIISAGFELSDEDFAYIQEVIRCNIDRKLEVQQDDNKNIRILLNDEEFLNQDGNELPLSAGELNFISLSFELLKAKNSNASIVVLDDPISSFDSIYKNKIVYGIVKILEEKDTLILTHNLDLVRLLEGQYKKCFKLHLFNNSTGSNNGFILLKNNETDVLLHIDKLLHLFKNDIFDYIKDTNLFLCSVIPFLRGYAQIVDKQNYIESLTSLMHGYRTEVVDISSIYENLVSPKITEYSPSYNITVQDILDMCIGDRDIIDNNEFPLLNKTLKHSLQYLQLRLSVEKTLTDIFDSINTDTDKQLGQIINKAFPNRDDNQQIKYRVSLTSKKTLLNEFNHFEGNLSIFQPAIDISDDSLQREKSEILSILASIKENYS